MAEFLEDPSVLTKDKLKNELTANNVPLPSGEHKKEVYVQLYLKNLTTLNNKKSPPADTFSSDDELPAPVVSNKSRSGRVSVFFVFIYVDNCDMMLWSSVDWWNKFELYLTSIFFAESYKKDGQASHRGSGGDRSHRWRFKTTAGKTWCGFRTHCWWVLSQTFV